MIVSLRTRLLLGVIVSTALLLGVFCVVLYTITRDTLLDQFDDSLLSTAKMLSAVVGNEASDGEHEGEHHEGEKEETASRSNGELGIEFDVRMTPEFNNPNGGGYYQFWNHDRSLIVRSPSLGKADLPYFGEESSTDVYRRCSLPDDKPGRAVSCRFVPGTNEGIQAQDGHFTIVVGRDASQLYRFLGFFRWLLLNCSIVIVLLSSYVGAKVTRIGLQPVHTLADEIESVDEVALDQSFSAEAYPAELVPICERLNALMERMKASFQRERRFNADVAHELRTPLAGIQSTIEVCLSRGRQQQEYQDALGNCLAISRAMNRLVDTLLALSRLETQQIAFETQAVSLKSLTEKIWRNLADKARDKELSFENLIDDSLCCVTDEDHLSMIISNILDNAVEYCDHQGRITVKAQHRAGVATLIISNTGCRLSPADAEHVFDFFWRADTARTDTGVHCGIGLAVVRKVAGLLGAKVRADIEQGSVFSIILELPMGQSVS